MKEQKLNDSETNLYRKGNIYRPEYNIIAGFNRNIYLSSASPMS